MFIGVSCHLKTTGNMCARVHVDVKGKTEMLRLAGPDLYSIPVLSLFKPIQSRILEIFGKSVVVSSLKYDKGATLGTKQSLVAQFVTTNRGRELLKPRPMVRSMRQRSGTGITTTCTDGPSGETVHNGRVDLFCEWFVVDEEVSLALNTKT